MAWIEVVPNEVADGPLKTEYEAARKRAGRVWNIIAIMGQSPATLRRFSDLYVTLMKGPSPLSRRQREMLAVVVSAANGCVY